MRRVALVALNGFVAATAIGGGIALVTGTLHPTEARSGLEISIQ